MNMREFLLTAGLLSCISGAAAFYSAPANAENASIVIAQNEEESGFWGKIFNRSDKSPSAKPLFLDRPAPSGQGVPHNYNNQTSSSRGVMRPSSGDDPKKIKQARDAAAQKRTDEILRLAAIENEKRSAALEKSILESNALAAAAKTGNDGTGDTGKKMVYDPQKAKSYNPNALPYTARPVGRDPEEKQPTAPTGRLYNAR